MYELKQTDRTEHLKLNLKTCVKERKYIPKGFLIKLPTPLPDRIYSGTQGNKNTKWVHSYWEV
jgi:hypothetical protein